MMPLLGSLAGWLPSHLRLAVSGRREAAVLLVATGGSARAEESGGRVGRGANLGGSGGLGGASYLSHFSGEAPTQAWRLHSATRPLQKNTCSGETTSLRDSGRLHRQQVSSSPLSASLCFRCSSFMCALQTVPRPQRVACPFISFMVFFEAPTL